MTGFWRRRAAVKADARALMMVMPGREAWLEARGRGSDMSLDEGTRTHWQHVSGRIEVWLGIDWTTDTATRFLEPDERQAATRRPARSERRSAGLRHSDQGAW